MTFTGTSYETMAAGTINVALASPAAIVTTSGNGKMLGRLLLT
jgi:hypothetical protein